VIFIPIFRLNFMKLILNDVGIRCRSYPPGSDHVCQAVGFSLQLYTTFDCFRFRALDGNLYVRKSFEVMETDSSLPFP
jgi:hypothetical protein